MPCFVSHFDNPLLIHLWHLHVTERGLQGKEKHVWTPFQIHHLGAKNSLARQDKQYLFLPTVIFPSRKASTLSDDSYSNGNTISVPIDG